MLQFLANGTEPMPKDETIGIIVIILVLLVAALIWARRN
jgi:hypothetical protein